MAQVAQAAETATRPRYEIVWLSRILVPIATLTLVYLALFVSFMGDQAGEIAKLVHELELGIIQLFEAKVLGNSPPAKVAIRPELTQHYAKLIYFVFALIFWCVSAHIATVQLFHGLNRPRLVFVMAAVITSILPLLILLKYRIVVDQTLEWDMFALSIGGQTSIFAIAAIVVTLLSIAALGYFYFQEPPPEVTRLSAILLFCVPLAMFAGFAFLIAKGPATLPGEIGTTNAIVIFVSLFYLVISGAVLVGQAFHFSFLFWLAVYVVAVNTFVDFGSAPKIKIEPVRNLERDAAASGKAGIHGWLLNRQDFKKYQAAEKPYPIYIVAASGGGMHAAMHTAWFLEYMQAKCPDFSHHLFAISAVSGGSLGAMAYAGQQLLEETAETANGEGASLARKAGCNLKQTDLPVPETGRLKSMRTFLRHDMVAPIVVGGLYPELLQRLLPVRFEGLARTDVLRRSMNRYWQSAAAAWKLDDDTTSKARCKGGTGFLDCGNFSYWRAEKDVPALIFNTTDVSSGFAFRMANLPVLSLANFNGVAGSLELPHTTTFPLAEGFLASAAFPVALPVIQAWRAGTQRETIPNTRLADGGYYDNSGLLAAVSLKEYIQLVLESEGYDKTDVTVQLIHLSRTSDPKSDWEFECGTTPLSWLPTQSAPKEVIAHTDALVNAQETRTAPIVVLVQKLEALAKQNLMFIHWSNALGNQASQQSDAERLTLLCKHFRFPLAFYYAPRTVDFFEQLLWSEYKDQQLLWNDIQDQLTIPATASAN